MNMVTLWNLSVKLIPGMLTHLLTHSPTYLRTYFIVYSMHGSGENHMAYFYKRIAIDKDAFVSTSTITLPARHWIDGEKEEVVNCDLLFKEASTVVLGSLDKFKKVVRKINETNSNAARPKRERKPVRKV